MNLAQIELLLENFVDPNAVVPEEHLALYEDDEGYSYADKVAEYAPEYVGWGFWEEEAYFSRVVKVPDLGYVEVECTEANHGKEISLIFKVYQTESLQDNPEIYRKNGWYSSYEGSCFEEKFEKVKPVQKTITVYEPWE